MTRSVVARADVELLAFDVAPSAPADVVAIQASGCLDHSAGLRFRKRHATRNVPIVSLWFEGAANKTRSVYFHYSRLIDSIIACILKEKIK